MFILAFRVGRFYIKGAEGKVTMTEERFVPTWVVDITCFEEGSGLLAFIPIENPGTPDERFVVGLILLTTLESFDRGTLLGVFHEGGQVELNRWILEHPTLMEEIKEKCESGHRRL